MPSPLARKAQRRPGRSGGGELEKSLQVLVPDESITGEVPQGLTGDARCGSRMQGRECRRVNEHAAWVIR